MGQYEHHVFVCASGTTRPSQGSELVHAEPKRRVKDAGLLGVARGNHAGCLDKCSHGPMVALYPQDVGYAGDDARGARRIVAEHLVAGRVVEEYRDYAPLGDNEDA